MTQTNDPPLVASVALIPDSDEKADLDAPSDESGKLVVNQAPNITITSTTVVADQGERLALDPQEGDIAIQQDTTESFIFTGGANELANWQLVQFDAVGGIAGEDIAPRDIDGRNVLVNDVSTGTLSSSMTLTANDVTINGLLNGADTSGAAAGEALTSDGTGGFGFASVGGIEEVATFGDLPALDPPQIGFVTGEGEYYFSKPISGFFDITNASLSTSISTRNSDPVGIAWNNDGSRLYQLGGFSSSEISQFTVSTPFDITSASFSKSISPQDGDSRGIAWNNDGSRLYEVGDTFDNERIYQSTVSTPFDIASASLDTSISAQDKNPRGIAWNDDGSRLYEVGLSGTRIYQSTLSTPFDIASASFDTSILTEDDDPRGIAWNDDGSRLYEVGQSSRLIYQSTLSTPFDISSASFSTSISTQDAQPRGIQWNDDGSSLYEVGQGSGGDIFQSEVTTGGWKELQI